MKEELQGKLVEILTSIQGAVGKASDFAMDQIPDIAMQYIRFSMAWSVAEIIILCIFLFMLTKFFRHCQKRYAETDWGAQDGWGFLTAGTVIVGIISVFGVVFNLQKLMMIWIAPKVWLIKELAGMIK